MQKITTIIVFLLLCQPALADTVRDRAQRNAFMKTNPCPSNGNTKGACPGYVVDHKIALACGGADHPSNMQWQSLSAGKVKDNVERKVCWASF